MYTNFNFILSFYSHVWCSHRCLFGAFTVFILGKYNREKSYDSSYANTDLIKIWWIFKWRRRYVTRCVSCLRGILWGRKPATESPQPMPITLEGCRVPQESVCARASQVLCCLQRETWHIDLQKLPLSAHDSFFYHYLFLYYMDLPQLSEFYVIFSLY